MISYVDFVKDVMEKYPYLSDEEIILLAKDEAKKARNREWYKKEREKIKKVKNNIKNKKYFDSFICM